MKVYNNKFYNVIQHLSIKPNYDQYANLKLIKIVFALLHFSQ